jgi:hypothetical protein
MVPRRLFFTKGVGKHKERLTSFELALRDAGIAAQNLVRVSSIFPPQAKLIGRKEGLKYLSPGEVVFAVVAENSTREPHRLVQMSCGPDPDANLDKAADRARGRARGANVVCLPELFRAQYFCQREDTRSSISPSRSPAPAPSASARSRAKRRWS